MNGQVILSKLLAEILVVVALGLAVAGTYYWQQRRIDKLDEQVKIVTIQLKAATKQASPTNILPSRTGDSFTSNKGILIKLFSPQSNTGLVSPVAVVGEVPGSWSFEASFPVQLKDSTGKIIAQVPAQLLGDWQTNALVPFSVKLTFPPTASPTGSLVLLKDNPSGLARNDDQVVIPIKF